MQAHSHIKYCRICGKQFEAHRANHTYCSDACWKLNYKQKHGCKLDKGRFCRQCGTQFFPSYVTGANQQHCSLECSKKSARESRSKFYKTKPDKMREYRQKWQAKVGTDSNLLRFYLRYPDASKCCQACGEDRVLEIAHRPGCERNGAWRNKANTTIEKVWILCPTCHKLLDRKGYTPEQLGIILKNEASSTP